MTKARRFYSSERDVLSGKAAFIYTIIVVQYNGCVIRSRLISYRQSSMVDALLFYFSAHENGGDLYSFKTKIIVTSDGSMMWLAPSILKSTCQLDISRFPFDKQTCELKIGSWVHNSLTINLNLYDTLKAPVTSAYKDSTEWELYSAVARKNTVFYTCCPFPYDDIIYTFQFHRKPLYYIMTLVLPCIVLSLLASISFLFPADSGERVSLVISVLLGLIVFMLIVNNKTPVTSDSTPMITKYFSAISCLTFLTLLATAFILRMHHAFPSNQVPSHLSSLRDFFAYVFCMKKDVCKKPTRLDLGEVLLADVTHLFNLREHGAPTATRKRLTEEKILEELQKLSRRLEDDDFTNEMKEEWQYTARVFDKLFFYVFLLIYLSFSVYALSFL